MVRTIQKDTQPDIKRLVGCDDAMEYDYENNIRYHLSALMTHSL